MKKLLTTTAMCLVFATGFVDTSTANETVAANAYESSQNTVTLVEMEKALPAEQSLFRGDFQQIARVTKAEELYAGIGSIKMASVVSVRY